MRLESRIGHRGARADALAFEGKAARNPQFVCSTRSTSEPRTGFGNQAQQHLLRGQTMQTKLTIGRSGDRYELEADRVAAEVLRMPEPARARDRGPLSVSSLGTGTAFPRMCPECSEELEDVPQTKLADGVRLRGQGKGPEKDETLREKRASGNAPRLAGHLEAQTCSLSGGGRPLPRSALRFFQPRFGFDFSRVRVHSDPKAANMAKAVSARAFTFGRDVVFGTGQYSPETTSGKRLLAHELVHVVQQTSSNRTASAAAAGTSARPRAADQSKVIVHRSPLGRLARKKVNRRHHTVVKDSKGRKARVAQIVTAGRCRTRPEPRSKVTGGVTPTSAYFEFRYCKGHFATRGKGRLEYIGALVDELLEGRNRPQTAKDLVDALKKAGPKGGLSLGLRIHSFMAKFEGRAKSGVSRDPPRSGQANAVLRYSKGKFRIEGLIGHKGLRDGMQNNQRTILQLNTDIGPVEVRLEGVRATDPAADVLRGQGIVRFRGQIGGPAVGGGVSIQQRTPPKGKSSWQIMFKVGVWFGGRIPEVKKPDCFICWCDKPTIRYECKLLAPPSPPKKQRPRQQIIPLFFRYEYATPQPGLEKEFDAMIARAVKTIASGYTVRRIEGRTSPEGPLIETRKGSSFEGNIKLAQKRADKAYEELKKGLSSMIESRRRTSMRGDDIKHMQNVLAAKYRVVGVVPDKPGYSAELFGWSKERKAQVEERDLPKHLKHKLKKPAEGERSELAAEHVTSEALPPEVLKRIKTRLDEFRSGRGGVETVYPIFRRALIFLEPPPQPIKGLTKEELKKAVGDIDCEDEHKRPFGKIPPGWETEGSCFGKRIIRKRLIRKR